VAETVGSLADKLSIVELKIHYMAEQTRRPDVEEAFRSGCEQRLSVLRGQRDDLAGELGTLVADIASGRVVPKVYRQFKMYNDPRYRRPPGKDGKVSR
jgi:Protein of unknown function (DUF4254)